MQTLVKKILMKWKSYGCDGCELQRIPERKYVELYNGSKLIDLIPLTDSKKLLFDFLKNY